MYKGQMSIGQLLVFAVLMQSGKGILGVAPSYLMDKYLEVRQYDNPEFLLDSTNKTIYDEWLDKWSVGNVRN